MARYRSVVRFGLPLLLALFSTAPARAQGSAAGMSAPRTTETLQRIDTLVNESQGLQRALNLARDTAIRLNGGLGLYRPATCMYAGVSNNPCLISRDDEAFVFRFAGGAPGWEQFELPPALETEVRVSRDGRRVLEVVYNGPAEGSTMAN